MKIRSANEIKSLDDELNLFEETDWDFLSVVDTKDTNFEYFNDIRDSDFDKRNRFRIKDYVLQIVGLCAVLAICSVIAIRVSGILDQDEYRQIAGISSVNSGAVTAYEKGSDASSEDLIAISGIANDYFRILKSEGDYNGMYDLCATTSNFADTYYSVTNKVQEVYDDNDCYARMLRELAGFCSLNKVTKVVVKDDTYYCYLSVNIPTSNDVYEYAYLYQYNFTKKFSNTVPTEAGIVQYLLDTTNENPISCSSTEICIKLIKKDGSFKIVDDSFATSTCSDAYTSLVNQISKMLGANLTTSH